MVFRLKIHLSLLFCLNTNFKVDTIIIIIIIAAAAAVVIITKY